MELQLTASEIQYILEVLNGRPYTEVVSLVPKIVTQVQEQQRREPDGDK